MEKDFVEAQIKRCDRNSLITNFGLLVIPALIFGVWSRYWYNFAFGPFPMTIAELEKITDASKTEKYFLTVKGDESIDTGFEEITTRKRRGVTISSSVSGKVVALKVDKRLLLVKVNPNKNQDANVKNDKDGNVKSDKDAVFTGYLSQIPSKIQTELIDTLESKEKNLKGLFLPFLLTANDDFKFGGHISLGIALSFLGIAGWNLFNVARRQGKLELHPIGKELAKFGNVASLAAQVDSQMRSQTNNYAMGKNVTITPNWIIRENTYDVQFANLEKIAWVYQKVTQNKSGKVYSAVILDQNGGTLEIPGGEADILKFIEEIVRRIPWVLAGYSEDLLKLWQKDRQSFLTILQQRREEMEANS